jgi:glycosyltransferase involved in cell wall biosynthesis
LSLPEQQKDCFVKRKVLVYKTDILPFSETFIRDQVLSYERWHGTLAGLRNTAQLSLDGVDVRLLRDQGGIGSWKVAEDIRRLLWALPRETAGRVAAEQPDIIHAHFGISGVEIWPLARSLGLPLIVTLHGSDVSIGAEWFRSGQGGTLMRFYPHRLLRAAAAPNVRFVAISESVRRAAIHFGIPSDKVTVRYIGIDPRKWSSGNHEIASRRRRILFIGRLIECKGCEHLVRAFLALKISVPDAELVIIGDGPLRKSLEELAKASGGSVRFVGAVQHEEVRAQLGDARVLCLPSISLPNGQAEGLGMVVLEAQASGVPVVAYKTGGISEAVSDGETGFLVAEGDESQLADRLKLILQDDATADRMSKAGPRFVAEHFDIRECTRKLELFYDAVAARGDERVEAAS